MTRPSTSPRGDLAALVERLNRVARREPTAVLGVLSYWLAPHTEHHRPSPDTALALRSPSL
jgi:hypothetical protein